MTPSSIDRMKSYGHDRNAGLHREQQVGTSSASIPREDYPTGGLLPAASAAAALAQLSHKTGMEPPDWDSEGVSLSFFFYVGAHLHARSRGSYPSPNRLPELIARYSFTKLEALEPTSLHFSIFAKSDLRV
jgi:hypothetical protein